MEFDHAALGAAMIRCLPKAPLTAKGQIRLPAIPALLDDHVATLTDLFAKIGRSFSPADVEHLRGLLSSQLEEGYRRSPYTGLLVHYETQGLPKLGLSYRISLAVSTMADEYAGWVKTRTPPLFGAHPDAKVMDLVASLGPAPEVKVLDIGAGTGRNTLPLARAGYVTDAVELSPALAAVLRSDIEQSGSRVTVFEGDVLGDLELPRSRYDLIVASEVVFHFRELTQVRTFFERTAQALAPGGVLCFSVFLAEEGYEPDLLTRQLAQAMWCTFYTRSEIADASQATPLELVSDESAHDYEKEHLPAAAWPPTGWFPVWSTGMDLFDLPEGTAPIDMRWLVYRRR
jgi:SAM-dependent methyltransferase